MKLLKQFLILFTLCLFVYACGSSPIKNKNTQKEEPVVIANDSLEYQIIIIDPGFNLFLNTVAQPEGYYSQSFLENRNQLLVLNWNQRAMLPNSYSPDLYQMQIDYQPGIDYGYEVNYKLYNYFIYFQRKYNQRLGPFVPRI